MRERQPPCRCAAEKELCLYRCCGEGWQHQGSLCLLGPRSRPPTLEEEISATSKSGTLPSSAFLTENCIVFLPLKVPAGPW